MALELTAVFLDGSGEVPFGSADDDGRLFYFTIFDNPGGNVSFETRGTFAYDPRAVEREVARGDHVSSSTWRETWNVVGSFLGSAGEVMGLAAAIKTLTG